MATPARTVRRLQSAIVERALNPIYYSTAVELFDFS